MLNKVEKTLITQAVPQNKARSMVQSVWRGLLIAFFGFVLLAGSVALMVLMILKGQTLTLPVLFFLSGIALVGLLHIVAGSNMMSGQALDIAASSPIFGLPIKLIRLYKPKAGA